MQYAVMGIHAYNGGYGDYFRKDETCLLTHAPTYKEACAAKADFLRTRREDFTRIWIEKVSGEYGEE